MPANRDFVAERKDDIPITGTGSMRKKSYIRTTPLTNYGAKTGGVEFVLYEKETNKDSIQDS